MKKKLSIVVLMLAMVFVFSGVIFAEESPEPDEIIEVAEGDRVADTSDDVKIEYIEIFEDKGITRVHKVYENPKAWSWITGEDDRAFIFTHPPESSKSPIIASTDGSKIYNLVDVNNIALYPDKTTVPFEGTRSFSRDFELIDEDLDKIHITRKEAIDDEDLTGFHWYDVELIRSEEEHE